MERWRMMDEGMELWHDVNDWKPLNSESAVQAGQLGMDFFKKNKVPRGVAEKMGHEVITTKWVDTNRGDTSRPD